jgi:hypothetical protein
MDRLRKFTGGTLKSIEEPVNYKLAWNKILSHAMIVSDSPYDLVDFKEMGRRVRALKIVDTILHHAPEWHDLLKPAKDDLKTFKQSLYETIEILTTHLHPHTPVLPAYRKSQIPSIDPLTGLPPTSLRQLQQSYSGRGIVISTGNWHFRLAYHLILSLRYIHNCSLPIEVFYIGQNDLDKAKIAKLEKLDGVKVLDLMDFFPEPHNPGISGWAGKPFSMMASSFSELVFLDADALFFQNPDTWISNSPIFSHEHAVFFFDRTMKTGDTTEWFDSYVLNPSSYSRENRYLTRLTIHEQESGVVLIDKSQPHIMHGMLTVCKMNSNTERDKNTYKHIHGDKETFWMGFELARSPYGFVPSYGGTVGYKNPNIDAKKEATGKEICGALYHTDENLEPLWWNGGVVKNKHTDQKSNYIDFEYVAFDLKGDNVHWIWETKTTPFCLMPSDPQNEIQELSSGHKELAKQMVGLYKILMEDKPKLIEKWIEGKKNDAK